MDDMSSLLQELCSQPSKGAGTKNQKIPIQISNPYQKTKSLSKLDSPINHFDPLRTRSQRQKEICAQWRSAVP